MIRDHHLNTIIIGAGAAGLACAACLTRSGVSHIVLEKDATIGNVWRNRYDRLHLHTTKTNSRLPLYQIPRDYPKYVSKDDFARYLEKYAEAFAIRPRFNQKVTKASRRDNVWSVCTETETFSADHLIIATGLAGKPRHCTWKGQENFQGTFLHSVDYRSGKEFSGKKVLVVGFGNSACEIAICLYEHNAKPALSVRNCVTVLPRDIAGISIVNIALLENWLTNLSPRLVDTINKPILRLINGNFRKFGLRECTDGPLTQIIKSRKIPLLDIGTMALIRNKSITVYPGIEEVGSNHVKFTDGREAEFDAIISATGYLPAFTEFLENWREQCDADGMPRISGRESNIPGLFFCGFHVSPTGMLREIGMEARSIAGILSRAAESKAV